ncbi:lipopolysaccharide biosynthesis protein [Perlabentimonas gracilis]|uniref:lipopolysaccharide biosynthesis protein n=1 Tax=Perlabentimonas gracilis TaxID=2715279 RepID=UPI00140CB4F2|nr:lipopolysaccharide biosynthesis protein [Perlabentimonas gracilis]NHB69847.1 lipopolysaccharide biosynthesis protein [Perlabentimonas gracilis]
MSNSLKEKATRGMLWSAVDRFAAQGTQFIISIVLARLLMPEDFGLIGMLTIFITLSQSFVDSGMGSGLIQKKNRTDVDFSTVFLFNIGVSLFFYLVLYFSAPLIASFYDRPELIILTRVLSLNIIINSLAIVQRSRLSINVDFKTFAKVNTLSIVISGAIAIGIAYKGFGVWALVAQNLLNAGISVILFWWFSRWTISLKFSSNSFKQLFSYGSKLLIASLYSRSLNEIYNAVIGRVYSAESLGFYTNAKKLSDATAFTITSILQQVTFPILSSLQDDKDRLVSVYSRLIRMTAFFIIPLMTLFALLADPFIRLLLTDKWEAAIPLLQWLCFARIVTPISAVNMSILNAVGRSDLFLKVDLSKLPMIVIALIITIPLGVKAMVIGSVVTSLISFFINAYMPGKLFGYGAFRQLRDILPVILSTGIMAIVVYLSIFFIDLEFLKLLIGGITGILFYILISYFLKLDELGEVLIILKKLKKS